MPDGNLSNSSGIIWPLSGYTIPRVIIAVIPVLLIIVAVLIGNCMVMLSITLDRKLRGQLQNWFIFSLAMADFLVGLLIMPFSLSFEIMGSWTFGYLLCELWLALDVLFVTASILSLCLISLDRYWSVTRPTTYPQARTPSRVLAMIFASWFLAFVISFPPLIGWRQPRVQGTCSLSTDVGYVVYSAVGSFYIPVVILLVVYSRIYTLTRARANQQLQTVKETERRLSVSSTYSTSLRHEKETVNGERLPLCPRKRSSAFDFARNPSITVSSALIDRKLSLELNKARLTAAVSNASIKSNNSANISLGGSVTPASPMAPPLQMAHGTNGHKISDCLSMLEVPVCLDSKAASFIEKQRQLRQKEMRSTIIVGTILLAFTGCWCPFFFLYFLGSLGVRAPESLFDIFFWLGYCNSALNPIVYTVFNAEFRRAFKTLLQHNLLCVFNTSFPSDKTSTKKSQIYSKAPREERSQTNGDCLRK